MVNRRRERFVNYFREALKGSREALTRKTGYTKGRITQLFDEDEPFGEAAARNLARRLELPDDYFEHDPGTPMLLTDEERDLILTLRRGKTPPGNPSPEINEEVDRLKAVMAKSGEPGTFELVRPKRPHKRSEKDTGTQ